MWLHDHPLIGVLGRTGRRTVMDALLANAGPWTIRELARHTALQPTSVSRAVADFVQLGMVDHLRPGRNHVVHLRDHPWVRALQTPWPTLHDAHALFARSWGLRAPVIWWHLPSEQPLHNAPWRLALVHPNEDDVWDAVPAGLDALRQAGWMEPECLPVARAEEVPGAVIARLD